MSGMATNDVGVQMAVHSDLNYGLSCVWSDWQSYVFRTQIRESYYSQ